MFEENAPFELAEVPIVNATRIEPTSVNGDACKTKANSQHQVGSQAHHELDSQANLLFGLIRDFKLLADRACDAAVREARHASTVKEVASAELTSLRLQLKEKTEAVDERDRALREREAIAKAQIDALESALHDKEEQLEDCQTRGRALLGEIEGLTVRLSEATSAMKQAEGRFRDFAEQQQGKISFLCQELKSKENLLQAKDDALRQLDDESRSAISSLENRLHAIDAILEIKDAELREKQAVLDTKAAHENTLAQLMQQLAVESQALMAELWEKNELVSELENKTYHTFDNAVLDQNGTVQERLL